MYAICAIEWRIVVNGESLSASKLNEMKDNDVVVNNEAEQHCK